MLSVFLTVILGVDLIVISCLLQKYPTEARTKKVTKPLQLIISLSPLIGIVIFTILFSFVLKGQLMERITHALFVFAIWMYATQFYNYLLAHYKNKWVVISCALSMILSIALAIIFTPLNRYVALIYDNMGWCSLFLGLALMIVFYVMVLITFKRNLNQTIKN